MLPEVCALCIQMYNDDKNSEEECKLAQDRPRGMWLRIQRLYIKKEQMT